MSGVLLIAYLLIPGHMALLARALAPPVPKAGICCAAGTEQYATCCCIRQDGQSGACAVTSSAPSAFSITAVPCAQEPPVDLATGGVKRVPHLLSRSAPPVPPVVSHPIQFSAVKDLYSVPAALPEKVPIPARPPSA